MTDEIDKAFQQYRQSAVLYSATVISVTLALSAALLSVPRTLALLQHPTRRVTTIGLVFLILLMASTIQYQVFRGTYLHANRFFREVIAEGDAEDDSDGDSLWDKGNRAFSAADRLTRGVFMLFIAFLVFAAVIVWLAWV